MLAPLHQLDAYDAYHKQIRRFTAGLVSGNPAAIADIGGMQGAERLPLFADGLLGKRAERLRRQFDLLPAHFDGFEELTVRHVKSQPSGAYASAGSEALRFLDWLEGARRLSSVERDLVACERCRFLVEQRARRNRARFVYFQDLLSVTPTLAEELDRSGHLMVHLNPIHIWARFETSELLGDAEELPAVVLFFPVGQAVSTAVLDPLGRALVEELSELSPCTLDAWSSLGRRAERDDLVVLIRNLAQMGLVALG
jgi:hypothetical protein